jgi:hypothetical protein
MPEPEKDDKDQHAQVGAALRLGTEAILPADSPAWLEWLGPRVVPAAVGAVKELAYDDANPEHHTKDGWDAAATALGALLMYSNDDLTVIPTISPDKVAIEARWKF